VCGCGRMMTMNEKRPGALVFLGVSHRFGWAVFDNQSIDQVPPKCQSAGYGRRGCGGQAP
jgi:hypothetical protein